MYIFNSTKEKINFSTYQPILFHQVETLPNRWPWEGERNILHSNTHRFGNDQSLKSSFIYVNYISHYTHIGTWSFIIRTDEIIVGAIHAKHSTQQYFTLIWNVFSFVTLIPCVYRIPLELTTISPTLRCSKKSLAWLPIFQLSPSTAVTQLELILIWFYTQAYYQGIVPWGWWQMISDEIDGGILQIWKRNVQCYKINKSNFDSSFIERRIW